MSASPAGKFVIDDIVDGIVELFEDDLSQLKNCSLVSHVWYSASRRHLYSCIGARDGTSNHPLADRGLSSLLKWFNENPEICPLVEILRIWYGQRSVAEVLEVVSKLPNLQTLVVNRLEVPKLTPPLAASGSAPAAPAATGNAGANGTTTRALPTQPLDLLFLCHCVVTDAGQSLFELVSAFPAVDTLRLEALSVPPLTHLQQPYELKLPNVVPSERTKVKNIIFAPMVTVQQTFVDFSRRIQNYIDMNTVESITLRSGIICDTKCIQVLLDAAVNLKMIELSLDRFESPEVLDLSPCSRLEVLDLKVTINPNSRNPIFFNRAFHYGLGMLTTLTSSSRQPQLRRVRLSVWIADTSYPSSLVDPIIVNRIETVSWDEFQSALLPFAGLEELEIGFYVPDMTIASLDSSGRRRVEVVENSDAAVLGRVRKRLADVGQRCTIRVSEYGCSCLKGRAAGLGQTSLSGKGASEKRIV